jgi:hypothetical protein
VCTLHGLPAAFALTGAKADERETLLGMFEVEPQLVADRPGQTLTGGANLFKPLRRSSSQSTRHSKASSTSNATGAARPAA